MITALAGSFLGKVLLNITQYEEGEGAGGQHAALDVCVVSSLQTGLVDKAAAEPGSALQTRYQQKWSKYGLACAQEGITFLPLPCEVLGSWYQEAVTTITKLSQNLARAGGQDEILVKIHLFGRLSILLMQGNSMLILSCSPTNMTCEHSSACYVKM